MKKLLRLLGVLVCAMLFVQLAWAQAAAPVISPAAGSYASTQSVTVTDSTSGADIFCTIDGSTPTPESTKYTGPLTVTATETVKCIAAVAGIRRVNIQNDDPNASGTYWKAADYINGGGSGTPTGLNHSSGHATPSLSGSSMEFSMTAQSGTQTNVLWAAGTGFGQCDTCSYELFDYQLYLDTGVCTNNGTTEQDDFKIASSLGNLRYMGGAQWRRTSGCTSGHACLDIGGNSNVHWTFTGVDIPLACGTFHHMQRAEHFVPAEVSSKPCVDFNGAHWPYIYEDYWIVDGTRYDNGGAGWKFCANSVNWPSWNAPQFQFDATNGTHTMYLDQANFTSYFPGSTVTSNAYTITGGTGTPTATTPAISPAGGFYAATQTVTITDSTPGAVIHYTTDGSTPSVSSTTYSSALTVSTTTTVKAVAIASGYSNSAVASAVYTFSGSSGLTPAPTFSPSGGSFTSTQNVSLSDSLTGAVIYYTSNGTIPTTSSNVYSVPLAVSATATIKAMAVAAGYTNSAVASATYTIAATLIAATPTFLPVAGNYGGTQTVAITDSTPSSTIYYTTDGTTPTTGSTVYSAPLTVSSTTTVKAIATASGYTTSAVGVATYTIGCGLTPYATGNIDPTQLKANARQGVGLLVQMAAGGFTTNYAAVFDCNGNLVPAGGAPITSLTTTGTSGAATLSGGILNIPVYGGGTPGGTSGQVQYNNAGAFGGFTVGGDGTLNTGTGALSVTKTGGVSFATSATTDTTNASNISSGTIVAARLPLGSSTAFGAVKCDNTSITCTAGVIASIGAAPTGTAGGDLSGTYPNPTVAKTGGVSFAASATTDTTNANNISSGTIAAARLPVMVGDSGSGGTKGAVPAPAAGDAAAGKYLKADGTFAVPPSGITQLIGDVTAGPGSGSQAATLATSGVTAGSYTSANITVDGKGRVTLAANGTGALPSGAGVVYSGTQNPSGGSPTTPTIVQSRALCNISSLAYTSNVTSGDLLVVHVNDETSTITAATISDTRGSTWSSAVSATGSTSGKLFYASANGSGADTVTIAGYTSAGWECISVLEASSVQIVTDGTAVGAGNTTTPGTLTTTVGNSLAVVGIGGFHSADVFSVPGGWSITQNNGHDATGIAWTTVASAGSVSPSITGDGSSVQLMAAFKAVLSGAFAGGSNGDYYYRTDTKQLFGPKASGIWPSTAIPYNNIVAGANLTATNDGAGNLTLACPTCGAGTGALVLLESHTASNSAELDFTTSITSTYDEYVIEVLNLVPATNSVDLFLQFSTNAGSTYDATSGHYAWAAWRWDASATGVNGSTSATSICLTTGAAVTSSTAANGGIVGTYKIFNPLSGTMRTLLTGQNNSWFSTDPSIPVTMGGSYTQTTAVNAFRIFFGSGNITSGKVRVYGIAH